LDIVERAINMLLDGEIERAEKQLKKLLKYRRNDYRVWFLKSLIEVKKNESKDALKSIDKALDLNKKFVEGWILRGKILRKLTKYSEAIIAFKEAIKIQEEEDFYNDYEIWIEIAATYFDMGNIKKAFEVAKIVEEINPMDTDLEQLMRKLNKKRHHHEMIEEYLKIFKL